MTMRKLSAAVAFCLSVAGSCAAQGIVSARSGTVHTLEGHVEIDGKVIEKRPSVFETVKEKSTLSTKMGRAEVLLTPGVFLRVGENSSFRMIDNHLMSTRVELLTGSIVLEQIDPQVNGKGNTVTVVLRDYEIELRKNGLMELYADRAQMKVYKGEAEVVAAGSQSVARTVIKEGREVALNAVLAAEKFDEKVGDDLLFWSRDRSQALSAANMASARGFQGNSVGGYSNSWYYNQGYGMFTFLPFSGTLFSPWGYGYYSPYSIYDVYYPGGYTWAGGGVSAGLAGVALAHTPSGTMANTLRSSGVLGGPAHSGGPITTVVNASRLGSFNRGRESGLSSPGFSAASARGGTSSPSLSSSSASSASSSAAMSSHASAGPAGGGASHSSGRGR